MEHIVDIRMTFWRLLDERGSNGFAAADLRSHLGKDWKTAPSSKDTAHGAISRSSQKWPSTAHGSHPDHTPRPIRRRSSALKPNSKRSSRYQASRSEKKALNFIPTLSSVSQKNIGGTRARITNSDPKRIEGWLQKK